MANMAGVSMGLPAAGGYTGQPAAAATAARPTAGGSPTTPVQAGPAYQLDIGKQNDWNDPAARQLKKTGKIECQTCKARKYQDGSNDPGVSFKAPGHIDPSASGAAVMAHEQEHVANEQANARSEKRQVVSQSVRLFTAVCPECGRAYVSGGETTTVTKADNSQAAAAGRQGVDLAV